MLHFSGGTTIEVNGTNLQSVVQPKMIVYHEEETFEGVSIYLDVKMLVLCNI